MQPVNIIHSYSSRAPRPRLGFIGAGWIGTKRLESIVESGAAEIVAIADASRENAARAAKLAPGAQVMADVTELLRFDLDGVAIATPNHLHAAQCIAALERGFAVFCQKPLARTAQECRRIIDCARANNRLLEVDFSYRGLSGARKIRDLIQAGAIGKVFAADLVFHNAYGPDKPWFYDINLSGGGAVLDLGIHLIDMALWCLGFPEVAEVQGDLYAKGNVLAKPPMGLEDFGLARIRLSTGATVNIACSWNISAGCDAVISATFFGDSGGAEIRNVNGSFTEFASAQFSRTRRQPLTVSDLLGAQQAVAWVERLKINPCFSDEIEQLVEVATTLDRIYGR